MFCFCIFPTVSTTSSLEETLLCSVAMRLKQQLHPQPKAFGCINPGRITTHLNPSASAATLLKVSCFARNCSVNLALEGQSTKASKDFDRNQECCCMYAPVGITVCIKFTSAPWIQRQQSKSIAQIRLVRYFFCIPSLTCNNAWPNLHNNAWLKIKTSN